MCSNREFLLYWMRQASPLSKCHVVLYFLQCWYEWDVYHCIPCNGPQSHRKSKQLNVRDYYLPFKYFKATISVTLFCCFIKKGKILFWYYIIRKTFRIAGQKKWSVYTVLLKSYNFLITARVRPWSQKWPGCQTNISSLSQHMVFNCFYPSTKLHDIWITL